LSCTASLPDCGNYPGSICNQQGVCVCP
jgi:hypothetical protein